MVVADRSKLFPNTSEELETSPEGIEPAEFGLHVEDLTLVADRGKIRLILENLLSNAIKYSPRGGVIYLRASASAEQLVLEVGDSGPGIPAGTLDRIFNPFFTTKDSGTGLGLEVRI